jgi:hypothetical protein
MGLETSTYVNGLNVSNPAATDGLSQADDHLRLIKATIKNTFPNLSAAMTSTAAELNILDGATVTTAELNILDGVTATAAELNVLDGITATVGELNTLDGITSSVAELNKLDGFTGSVAALNYAQSLYDTGVTSTEFNTALDGITATAAELNKLDGATVTTTELNKLSGVSGTIWHNGNDALSYSSANSSNGYVKLPNGLYIQWGVDTSNAGYHTVTFPIAFPSYCFSVVTAVGEQYAGEAWTVYYGNWSRTRTGFTTYASTAIDTMTYIAIGI